MSLITVNIPEPGFRSFLSLLERLTIAVERIAGPLIVERAPVPATLKDYAMVTPEDADQIRQAQEDFGKAHMLVPGSPAYLSAIKEFEDQVKEVYGEDGVADLPWNARTGNPPAQ